MNKKHETFYEVLGIANNANNEDPRIGSQVIYKRVDEPGIWYRNITEFIDKFEWQHD